MDRTAAPPEGRAGAVGERARDEVMDQLNIPAVSGHGS
jgi:hypothetical protein